MKNCVRCYENSWSFEQVDGYIRATCRFCADEVEFPKFRWFVGKPCTTCRTPVIYKEARKRPKQLKKSYYYTAYLYCPVCRKIYYSPKYRVDNPIDNV